MAPDAVGSVFISYSRTDENVVRRTATYLRTRGLTVWVDNEKLTPGTPIWEAEIEKAIRAAAAIIVFMSPDSKDSEWVRREITLADQYRKRIFPVLVRGDEDSSITLRLVTRQFVDLRGSEKTGLISLHQAVSQYLAELNAQDRATPTESTTSTHITAPDAAFESRTSQSMSSMHALAIWLAVGWAVCGMIAGYVWSELNDSGGELIAGALGGGGGGLITALILRTAKAVSRQISTFRSILAWAIGMSIAWLLGWEISDGSVAAGLGMAFAAIVGLAGTLGLNYLRNEWQGSAMILLAWFIGGAIIWVVANTILIDTLYMNDKGAAWAIGAGIGWAIGGYVMGRQLLK